MPPITANVLKMATARIAEDMTAPRSIAIMDALGNLDELSCVLGLAGDEFEDAQLFLSEIMGYIYARRNDEVRIGEEIQKINDFVEHAPASFNGLPKGWLPMARAVCRRTERSMVKLNVEFRETGEFGYNAFPIIQYLDRLSDYITAHIAISAAKATPETLRMVA